MEDKNGVYWSRLLNKFLYNMPKIVQYSPDPSIVECFSGWFMYRPENWWVGITSMNRLRKLTESLGVIWASKKLIIAMLEHSGWGALWYAISTDCRSTLICKVNIEKFKQTVFWALISGMIEGHITQEWITPEFRQSLRPVMKSVPSWSSNKRRWTPSHEHQLELEFSD